MVREAFPLCRSATSGNFPGIRRDDRSCMAFVVRPDVPERSVLEGSFMHRRRLIISAILLFVLSCSPVVAGGSVGVAVDDFSYSDTSGEPTDQTAAHARRLAAFMAALRRDIGADPRYRLVPSAQDGAEFKVIGGIQKTSTLVQWAKVAVIDIGARKLVMDKLYSFRGDNDESWQRAEIFLSREILAALATARATGKL